MTSLKDPEFPIVVRTKVESGKPYKEYQEYLRYDFWFSCAYCSISEVEALGVGFHIDHFKPQCLEQLDPHRYDNLMWSCAHCNLKKGGIWPPDDAQENGYRYVKPDVENPNKHYKIDGIRINPKTNAGEFTIEILYLNREFLRRLRKIRKKFYESNEQILLGLQAFHDVSIDQIPPHLRTRFIKLRKELDDQNKLLRKASLAEYSFRHWNRSPLIDTDNSEAEKHSRKRREYLRELQAIYPDPWMKNRSKTSRN